MKTVRLEELLDQLIDHRGKTPKKLGSDFTQTGVPVASAQLVAAGTLDLAGARCVDEETWRRWMPTPLEKGDVLLTSEAPLGRVAWVEKDTPLVLGQRLFALRVAKGLADSRYLGYWLSSAEGQASLRAHATGSTVSGIRQSALRKVEVPVHDVGVQQAIGCVLGALDDKIAANQEVSRCIDAYLGALFDRELANSIRVRLGDVADVNADSVKPVDGGRVRYVDISSLKEGDLLTPTQLPWSEAPGRARRAIHSGDTLWSTVRPNRRSHALMLGPGEGLVASTGIAVLTPRKCHPSELYEATRRAGFQEYLESVAEGSAYPAVRADRFSDATIDLLQGDGRERFGSVGEVLRTLQWGLREENERLAATRDELLPLLMSGRISVKDAEKAVEEVV